MLPNEQVYGAASTWIHRLPTSGYAEDNRNFVPAWQTIAGGINAGKLTVNTSLDDSICYAAIAADAPAASVTYFQGSDITNIKENTYVKEDFFVGFSNPYINDVMRINYYDVGDSSFPGSFVYSPVTTLGQSNPNSKIQPLCSVSLKDLVLCVYVIAYNSDFTASTERAYNGYRVQDATNYPNVVQVYGIPYCRLSGLTNRSPLAISNDEFGGVFFCRLNEYDIPVYTGGKIRDYNATAIRQNNDCKILLWGMAEPGGITEAFALGSNYIHRAVGQGGTLRLINDGNNAVYYRPFDLASDWVQRAAASYGCFFTDRTSYAQTLAYASANMRLGTIDEDGLCHGDYTTGDDNRDQPQYSWLSTNESTYNPATPIDPNTYSNATTFNTIGNLASMHKRYVLNAVGVGALMTDLWTISNDFITNPTQDVTYEDKVIDNFLTNNPIDCIVSLERYPLNPIPRGDTLLRNIKYGRITGQAAGYIMPYTSMQYDFQSIEIWPRFGNCFLDYSPYTRLELYIPFCGTTELDPSDFINRNLSVRMYIDFTTGTCTAYILSNSMVVKSVNGECSIKIPVSGIDTTTMQSQIQNAIIQERKAYGQAAGLQYTDMTHLGAKYTPLAGLYDTKSHGFGGKDLSDSIYGKKAAGKIWDLAGAQYNLEHQVAPIHQIGGATAATSWAIDLQCRLLIYSPTGEAVAYKKGLPVLADLTQYAHLNGFAMLADDTLSKYHGFTVITSIDLSGISATDTEQAQIMQLLTSGVYLP